MLISIITPSFRQLEWLRLCVASVRDQVEEKVESGCNGFCEAGTARLTNLKAENGGAGSSSESQFSSFKPQLPPTLRLEHIIQDAGTPGIEDFAREIGADFYRDGERIADCSLSIDNQNQESRINNQRSRYRIAVHCERDNGMYDAINRGLARAGGDICCYLNCDEQYLPDSLNTVGKWFAEHADIKVLFGDAVVVGPDGSLIAFRRAVLPQKAHTLVSANLSILTCATFFRRELIDQHILFPPTCKVAGDAEWVLKLLNHKIPCSCPHLLLSAFTESGENLALSPSAATEQSAMAARAPAWVRRMRPAVIAHYRIRKLLAGAYSMPALEYAVYTKVSPGQRSSFSVRRVNGRWARPHPVPQTSKVPCQ